MSLLLNSGPALTSCFLACLQTNHFPAAFAAAREGHLGAVRTGVNDGQAAGNHFAVDPLHGEWAATVNRTLIDRRLLAGTTTLQPANR